MLYQSDLPMLSLCCQAAPDICTFYACSMQHLYILSTPQTAWNPVNTYTHKQQPTNTKSCKSQLNLCISVNPLAVCHGIQVVGKIWGIFQVGKSKAGARTWTTFPDISHRIIIVQWGSLSIAIKEEVAYHYQQQCFIVEQVSGIRIWCRIFPQIQLWHFMQ